MRELASDHEAIQTIDANERNILGLGYVVRWSRIRVHTAMMTMLVERCDNKTCTFHLSIGDATITLVNVRRILKIPI